MDMRPIAHIRTDLPQKFGIPRNSFLAPHLQGRIVFEPEFALPQAVAGLEEFSHLWLLWAFENGAPGGTAADIAADASAPVRDAGSAAAAQGARGAVAGGAAFAEYDDGAAGGAMPAGHGAVAAMYAGGARTAAGRTGAGGAAKAAAVQGAAAAVGGVRADAEGPAAAVTGASSSDMRPARPSAARSWSPTVRPPRLGGAERRGVFATRSPFRPNPLGLTCVKLDRVELGDDGPVIHVLGADLRDGTPIFDIKPYIPFADCHPDATGGWIDAAPWQEMDVDFAPELQEQVPAEKLPGLVEVLRQDPRRAGSKHEPTRVYHLAYAGLDVAFTVDGDALHVVGVAPTA